MVKTYLRYEARSSRGIIASPAYGGVLLCEDGKHAITSALESVCIWNIKQGLLIHQLEGGTSVVTAMALHPDGTHVAAGYDDGSIRIWNIEGKSVDLNLNGHRSAVSALRYNANGALLVSGSSDTNLIVWDCVGEAGLYRLHGHKNRISDCTFLTEDSAGTEINYLISCSTDKLVKVWDLDTQHCVQTLTHSHSEVWTLDISPDRTRLVVGSGDRVIRAYQLGEGKVEDIATLLGEVPRLSRKRLMTLRYSRCGSYLGSQAADKALEIYRIRSSVESKKKMLRRAKRQREKGKKQKKPKKGEDEENEDVEEEGEAAIVFEAKDEFEALPPMRSTSKLIAFCFGTVGVKRKTSKTAPLTFSIATSNNTASFHSMTSPQASDTSKKETAEADASPFSLISSITAAGHRSGVRSVCLSSDNTLMMTTDMGSIKLWNMESGQCIRTLESGYGLSGLFVPGDRHVIIGTREGCLEVWEVGAGLLLDKIQAHDGPVWCIDASPDKKGLISGGSDKEVKSWEYELVTTKKNDTANKKLELVHTRTLKMTEEVLCVKNSPDGRLIAVGLLDATVKVFHSDSLKFFLSLYGHKLPVLTIDISSDSTLLVSGSADKNIKIWGLDFGDCHKSMFAHTDSIMAVKWVPKTHYFFTVGKDKLLKFWDGDKFEQVLSLPGHHSEIWGLAVSKGGDYVVTVGNDRSIRRWEQTDEQVFLEEERENRLDEMFDDGALVETQRISEIEGYGLDAQSESSSVARQKVGTESLKAGERLMEALDLVDMEVKRWAAYKEAVAALKKPKKQPKNSLEKALTDMKGKNSDGGDKKEIPKPPANVLMMNKKPDEYMLHIITKIKAAELEEALMVLPLHYVKGLIHYIRGFIAKGKATELCLKCLLFLLTIHQNQIISNQLFVDDLMELRKNAREQLRKRKDAVGSNLAAVQYLLASMKEDSTANFFGEAPAENPLKNKNKKRKLKD